MENMKMGLIAISLFAAVAAEAGARTTFTVMATQIDNRVIGMSEDGHVFAVTCKRHVGVSRRGLGLYYSAEMRLPNTNGDVLVEMRPAIGEVELSQSVELTEKAAAGVCGGGNGRFTFEIALSGENPKIELVSALPMDAPVRENPAVGQVYALRTALVDSTVIGQTDDGHFYAIACDRGMIRSSTADFIYPNWAGRVIVKSYNNFFWGRPPLEDMATYMPMDQHAVKAICNFPHGKYVLQVNGTTFQPHVNLVSETPGMVLEANGNGRSF